MAVQVGLCLAWSETPKDRFCCVAAHLYCHFDTVIQESDINIIQKVIFQRLFCRHTVRQDLWRRYPVAKDANLYCSKLLIIWPLWVRAYLGSHVRQTKFCLEVVRWFFFGIYCFCPTFRLTQLRMSAIILTGCKTQNQKKKKNDLWLCLKLAFDP